MKKLFISMMAAVMSLSAVADVTTTANIKLVGSNTTYANYTLRLKEDANRTNAYESGYDVESMMSLSNPFSVLIYGLVEDKNCEEVAAKNLDGLHIGFITNMVDASYTIQFSNVSGRALKLYDLVENVETDITEGESYAFSVESSQVGQVAINDRFVINYVPAPTGYTVTPNAEGYATFSADEATVIPAGVTVYRGVIAGEELQLTAISDYVPANTGVIVKGTAGTDYTFAIASTSVLALSETNDLKPTSAYSYPMENVYVLKGDAFLEYIGTDALKANKAFIQLGAGAGAPKRIRMVVNHATGVENAAAEVKAEKFVENGQVLIRRGNEVYNLQGQKLR